MSDKDESLRRITGHAESTSPLTADSEALMKIWLPDFIYRFFPTAVAAIGVLGCLSGTNSAIGLGGVLLLYSGGILLLRK